MSDIVCIVNTEPENSEFLMELHHFLWWVSARAPFVLCHDYKAELKDAF